MKEKLELNQQDILQSKFLELNEEGQLKVAKEVFGDERIGQFAYYYDQEHSSRDRILSQHPDFGADLNLALQYIKDNPSVWDESEGISEKFEKALSDLDK